MSTHIDFDLGLNAPINNNSKTQPKENNTNIIPIQSKDSSSETRQQILETAFSDMFKKYQLEYSLETLEKLTGEPFTNSDYLPDERKILELKTMLEICLKDKSCYDSDKKLNMLLATEKFQNIKSAITAGCSVDDFNNKNKPQSIKDILKLQSKKECDIDNLSDAEKTELITDYFKKKLEECKNNDDIIALTNDLFLVLYQTEDADKKLLLNATIELSKRFTELEKEGIKNTALDNFFQSFKDKNIAIECANNADLDEEIFTNPKYMKLAAVMIDNMSDINIMYNSYRIADNKYNDYYKVNETDIEDIVEKVQNGQELNKEEQLIYDNLQGYWALKSQIQTHINTNKNISKEEKQDLNNRIIENEKQYKTYNLYLETLAKTISESKNISDEDKTKIIDTINKSTNNEFIKVLDKIPEKTAQSASLGFNNNNIDYKATDNKIKDIKKELRNTEDSADLVIENLVQKSETQKYLTPILTSFHCTPEELNNILFEGSKKDFDNFLQQYMIKNLYKSMNEDSKILVLSNAKGNVFSELLKDTEFNVLKSFVNSGKTCSDSTKTQELKDLYNQKRSQQD